MHKKITSRKMKSISVEDLRTIVKQMINGTLEDTELMSKLHRSIYEELYFEKMTIEAKTLEENLGKNLSQKIFKTELIQDTPNKDQLKKSAEEESNTNGTLECKDFVLSDLKDLEENLGKNLSQKIFKTELIQDTPNKDQLKKSAEEELNTNGTLECKDFVLSDLKDLEENLGKNLSQKIFKTELIQDTPNKDQLKKSAEEESNTNGTLECKGFVLSDLKDSYKVQETANEFAKISITHIEKPEEIRTSSGGEKNKKILDKNALRNEQAFDIWRKEKMKAMRRMLKEERRKRQEELTAKQEEIERKKATHEAYLRLKKLVETNRKLDEAQKRATRNDYSKMQNQENARIVANEEAFKAWIKQKNSRSSQRYSPSQRCRPQTARTKYSSDVVFDSWLDQLDSVLHQKYLRERRYLVRSFYCQPAYYGTAALCMQ